MLWRRVIRGKSGMVKYGTALAGAGKQWRAERAGGQCRATGRHGEIKTGLTGDMTTLAVPEPIASLPKFYTSTMPAIHSVPRDPGVP